VPAATKQIHTISNAIIARSLHARKNGVSLPGERQKKGLYYLTYFRSDGKGSRMEPTSP